MPSLKALKVKYGRVKACITRACTFIDTITSDMQIEELQSRLHAVEDYWRQFVDVEDQLCELQDDIEVAEQNDGVPESGTHKESFEQIEIKYFFAKSSLTRAINDRSTQAKASETSGDTSTAQPSALLQHLNNFTPQSSDVVLPKIVIPPFSGDYRNWGAFRDLFFGAVDNKRDLTKTQKFYYLVSFLRDEAADLIKNIPITDDHYLEAWEKLEHRYDRPHLVASTYIQEFMKLPSTTTSNPKIMRKIHDGADECLRGLRAINMNGRDPWLIFLLLKKLDATTREDWCEEVGSRTDVSVDKLLQFLDKRFTNLESSEMLGDAAKFKINTVRSHVSETTLQMCLKCKEQHYLSQCPEFNSLSIESRSQFAKTNSLCFNCLKEGHMSSKCKSSFRCRVCHARHHTLLHFSPSSGNVSNAAQSIGLNTSSAALVHSSSVEPLRFMNSTHLVTYDHHNTISAVSPSHCKQTLASNHTISHRSQIVLPTAIVRARDHSGKFLSIRALIDTGSQVSFISESCAQRLGRQRKNARLSIRGVASTNAGTTRGVVNVDICSVSNTLEITVHAYILNRITCDLPVQEYSISDLELLSNLKLADPHFNVPGPVDLLLGADIAWSVLTEGKLMLQYPRLYAMNSVFGWIISGQLDSPSVLSNHIVSHTTTIDVDQLLQRFWQLDECQTISPESNHDDPAELNFRRTHSIASDGKYIVELPFTTNSPVFANTLSGAISRLRSMERRFNKNPEIREQYTQFMSEYLSLGHMELVPQDEVNRHPQYYLPHHSILKPDSSTTKLRVVFDGSFKDSFGKSLNDTLLIGPSIQRDLFGVSLRFREFAYVFTADVTKMFRQIWVAPHHRDYQRIVWRNSIEDPILHFRLRTVTYGTASAPFLSVRVLQQLAHDNKVKFPRAADIILNNVYVDDIMTGADSVEELRRLKCELVALLDAGGFKLRKWSSNSRIFLDDLPIEDCECSLVKTETPQDKIVKILGLYWNPYTDNYSFRVSQPLAGEVTKRHILSQFARIFDIHGFLAPSILLMKVIFQRLWLLKVGWDDPLPSYIVSEWMQLRDSLHHFEKISIPRRLPVVSSAIELHCFCDTSASAYAAVIYCVSRENGMATSVNIVAAKTRVAPIKLVSIPRMELCGALLLCRLLSAVKRSLRISNIVTYAWTDSEIVLFWLSSPPRNWKMFVANRTEEILSTVPRSCWDYVSTQSNPADCASRGLRPDELIQYQLWWRGPHWLIQPKIEWPKTKFSMCETSADIIAERRKTVVCVATCNEERPVLLNLADNVSSWNRLLRSIAYIHRFISLLRHQNGVCVGAITFSEIHRARAELFTCVQMAMFADTIQHLKANRVLPQTNQLIKLSPFLDALDVLRVGGRIQNASVSYNIKHPVILPRCHVTELLARNLHENYMHVGASELFVILRQHYWVIGARNLCRSIVFKCKRCFMHRRQTSSQVMANLPDVRVQQARPFLNSGCDFAGPLTIKMTNCKRPRITKAYICIFVCMSTKALHLELVSDLSAEAFIAAFKRFTSRRGKCSNLYTDNGTNFQGARGVLDDMQKLLISTTTNADIAASLAKDGTNWHFIPPSAPHFGGIWESGVKSVKMHLRRVIGETLLSFEEMYTVLTQIEAILNSRPLCSISDTDLNPLTPSHFLIGEPLTAVPEPSQPAFSTSRVTHWNLLRNMVQGFWKRWSAEYVTSLQQRPKWNHSKPNYAVGELIVLKEQNLPPSKWLLGRIIEVHPGSDGHVRVVTIKTAKGIYTRPVTRIALLPTS